MSKKSVASSSSLPAEFLPYIHPILDTDNDQSMLIEVLMYLLLPLRLVMIVVASGLGVLTMIISHSNDIQTVNQVRVCTFDFVCVLLARVALAWR